MRKKMLVLQKETRRTGVTLTIFLIESSFLIELLFEHQNIF